MIEKREMQNEKLKQGKQIGRQRKRVRGGEREINNMKQR